MTDLTQFNFHGNGVRTVADEHGEPWFVAADVVAILDIGRVHDAVRNLDDDEKGADTIRTLGGDQQVTTVSESGLYSLVIRSRKPEAREFKRWITHEVLPSIRKTGRYQVEQITRADLARMVLAAEEQLAIAAPKAEAFEAFLSTEGDYSVNEAAKMLSRDHGILTGEKRLRDWMFLNGWLYRDGSMKPRAYQRHIDLGRLAEKAQWHYHPATGERVTDTPQVRVSAKGLDDLRKALTKEQAA